MYKRENHSLINDQPIDMSTIPHLPIYIEDENIENGSRVVVKRIRPDWDLEKIRYKLFTDGITNKLIGLFNDSCPEEDGVLVRVYGKNTDQIIDRSTEFENFKVLYYAKLAPVVYATFDNGMAYKYIQGETLTTTTVREPSIYKLVAKMMARFHRLDVSGKSDGSTYESGLWNKMNQFVDLIPEHFSTQSVDIHPRTEGTMDKLPPPLTYPFFYSNCQPDVLEAIRVPNMSKRYRKSFTQGVEGLRTEIETLKAALENTESPVVFSHNDLLLNNIILQRDTAGSQPVNVAFIDYEYAMLNYQAFDIANHFIEFSGVQEPDFSLYPNVELQMDWLTSYLEEYLGEPLDQSDQRVAVLKSQVDVFAITSHLLWTFWAIVQAELSEIDFDYLRYAELRFEQYIKMKKLLNR